MGATAGGDANVCSASVAAGSGTSVQEINKLLKMHQQMAGMMKKMASQKGGLFGGGMMQKMLGGLGGGLGGGLPGLPGGMGGLGGGGMPDLSRMDPKELERMAQQMGVKLPKGGMGKKR